jgi:hypothetical protein
MPANPAMKARPTMGRAGFFHRGKNSASVSARNESRAHTGCREVAVPVCGAFCIVAAPCGWDDHRGPGLAIAFPI